ncbi:MAG: hypothetical protein K5790_10365 [Nitrosopumilus sp.]|uniref:GP88 family protein n=1 Tax=Nitrosopumilus sp. TaxID=2024843 RepID=UPI00247B4F12|nr:hypothetical protein [Nitrosopumilus sp.]MCV0393673.1 hypothetical protein [Nitrosopumilus sp.]
MSSTIEQPKVNTRGIILSKIPKKGGKYSTKMLRVLKKIFIDLKIEDRFDEEELSKYARFYLEEMIFLGKREIGKKNPNGNHYFMTISEFPYVRIRKNRRNQKNMIVEGNIDSYHKAIKVIGSLSKPSKIPTYGYALPVSTCNNGSKLHLEENTSCSCCYGFNGWYSQSWVKIAMEKRSIAIFHQDWVDAMVYLIKYHEMKEFRWHDTGDLVSVEHLSKIVCVAMKTRDTVHWLPTQEKEVLEEYWKSRGKIPLRKFVPNLKIRLSAIHINEFPDFKFAEKIGVLTSMVSDGTSNVTFNCIASFQNNKCKDCRKCWTDEPMIVYRKH